MRLNVGVLRAEELAGALDGERFGLIDKVAAVVITLAGVALGILVREDRTHRLEDGVAGIVFRSDQLQAFLLPALFVGDDCGDFRIDLFKRPDVCAGHHCKLSLDCTRAPLWRAQLSKV